MTVSDQKAGWPYWPYHAVVTVPELLRAAEALAAVVARDIDASHVTACEKTSYVLKECLLVASINTHAHHGVVTEAESFTMRAFGQAWRLGARAARDEGWASWVFRLAIDIWSERFHEASCPLHEGCSACREFGTPAPHMSRRPKAKERRRPGRSGARA